MGYPQVEEALLDVIRLMSNFSASNTARGDPRKIAQGNQKYCHLRFGGFSIFRDGTPNRLSITWIVHADLWFRSRGEYKYYNDDVGNTVQDFIEQVYGYPSLNGQDGVILSGIDPPAPAMQWQTDVQNWWIITLPINIIEKITIPLQE